MLNKKKISIFLVTAIIAAISIYILPLASAGAGEPLNLPVCQEGVNPFSLGGNAPSGDTSKYLNVLSESTCKQHSPYANEHFQLTEGDRPGHSVTQDAKTDNIHAPFTRHHHRYYNNSQEDNFFYKGYVAKFEITVEKDGFTKTQLNELQCPIFTGQSGPIYNSFKNCVDQAFDPNHFGGIRLHRKTVGNSIVLTWEFGVNGQGGRPWTPGINPSIDITPQNGFPMKFSFDTTDPVKRRWAEYVQLKTKENLPENIWSGTTTSRILIADAAIHKGAVSTNPAIDKWNVADPSCMQGWCLLNPSTYVPNAQTETVYSNGNPKAYYWHKIGTVSTIWNKEAAPESVCTGLEITAPNNLTHLNNNWYEYTPNSSATFVVNPSFSDFEVPLDYKWNAKEHKINIGKIDFAKIKENKIQFNYNLLLQNNLMQISIGQVPSLSIQNQGITINPGIKLFSYGKFYNSESEFFSNPSIGLNPYYERDTFGMFEDKSTYYTGGPEGTIITVEAVNKGGTAYVGNECRAFIIIPKPPKDNSCIDLTLSPDSLAPWTEQTFTATPEFEDPSSPFLLDIEWSTSSQPPIVQYSSNNGSSIPAIIKDSGTDLKVVNPGDFIELQPGIELKSIGGTNLLAKAGSEDLLLSPGALGTLKPSGIDIGPVSPDAQPDQPMQPLSLYDWFEDYTGTEEYYNPFLDVNTSLPNDIQANYTGGAPGTWLTAKAYDKDGSLYPLCVASIQIPPEEVEECVDLEIYRNGTQVPGQVPVEDPLDNLDLQVQTDPTAYFSELEYVWETTGGSLSTNGSSGTTVTTQTPAATVDLTGGTSGTTVNVFAIDPSDNTIFPACTDEFTLATSPQNICLDLQLINTNPNLKAGENTALKANPINQNSPHPNLVQWSEQGSGYFTLGATSMFLNNNIPGTCPTPPVETNQTFKASKACDYIYNAGPNGGGSFHVEADPNLGDVATCKFDYTVPTTPPPGTPYCTDLNISPNTINRGDRTVYSGNATFSDGKTYNVDIDWSGQNGKFLNGSTFQRQSNIGSNNFSNNFTHSPDNASGRVEVEVSKVYDNDVSTNFSQCREVLTIPALDDECNYLNLKWITDDLVCVDTDHDGNFVWGKNDEAPFTTDKTCFPEAVDIDTDTITVEAVGFEEECNDEWNPDEIPPEYDLEKYVSKSNRSNTYSKKIQTIANDHKTLWYKLVFSVEGGQSTTATITDDIFEGDLLAEIYPENVPFEDLPAFRGRISYDNRLEITEDGKSGDLQECDDISLEEDEDPEHCYNIVRSGRGFAIELVRVTNDVTIQYQAEVQSGLNNDECQKGKVCQEKYRNRAEASIEEINEERVDMRPIRSNEIEIQIFCQYILTQAAGDVFLERDLTYGVDIQQCSEFTSVPGVVIVPDLPDEPTIVSTGAGATVFSVSHELCTTGQTGGLVDAYGQEIVPNLSAQICEVKLRTGESWKKEFITNSIEENKTRLSRWGADYTGDINMFSLKGDLSYEDKSVFHIAGNLTINTPYTLNDGDGAKTFIVEGDLNILDNIEYGACPADKQPCTIRETASLAFIVLNGNIYIDPNVKTISGVYFVQGEEGSNNGRLYSGTSRTNFDLTSDITLRVFGSIYGDIDQLFKNRSAAGDPALGEAGITIRFDERIILNTPAGLRDVLNLSQTEVAR